MFILDIYRFCEKGNFTRKDLTVFIYNHREAERLARAAGMTLKFFAGCASREFLGRCMSLGYLDTVRGVVSCKGADRRPFDFQFHTLSGPDDKYVRLMANIGGMDDSEIFGRPGCY